MTFASARGRTQAGERAGAQALALLAVPINARVLVALSGQARTLADLLDAAGSPPPTTLRDYLRSLSAAGMVEKHRAAGFPGAVEYRLGERGRGLLQVVGFLDAWLAKAPTRPIQLGTPEAKNAIKALVDGWTSSMIRALAARPLTLTELDSVIASLSYPSLERRLTMMRRLGMLEAVQGQGRGTPYAVTDWLRQAIVPLAAATRWEHRYRREEAPSITNRDIETAFLLSVPLARLPKSESGTCRLAVRNGVDGGVNSLVGVVVELRDGAIVECVTSLERRVEAWVLGSSSAWFAAIAGGDFERLELGGEPFGLDLVTAMRRSLLALEGLHGNH